MKLNGKVALITGAASGIGHAIAKRYLEADGRVVIADLDPAKAAQAASELGDKNTVIGIRMDVSNEEAVNAGVDQAAAAFGTVDVLVSNAGIQTRAPDRGIPVCRVEEDASHPSRRRISDHQGLRQIHVQAEVWRADLHGLGAQS